MPPALSLHTGGFDAPASGPFVAPFGAGGPRVSASGWETATYTLAEPTYYAAFGVEDPRATELRVRYERYAAAQYPWAEQAAEDLQFVYNVHWTEAQAKALLERGQMPVSIPVTFQLVDQAVSLLTANRPAFQCAAREDSDALDAKLRSDLLAWMWEQSGANKVLRPTVFDAYSQGRGVLLVHVDPHADNGKGEVRFTSLSPFEVFPDPNATDPLWDDAQDVVVRRLMTAAQIAQTWPTADLAGMSPATNDYLYGPTTGDAAFTRGQQLFPSQVQRDPTIAGHEQFEVLERYEKVRVPHYRLRLPDGTEMGLGRPGREEVLTEAQLGQALRRPALTVMGEGQAPQHVTDRDALAQMEPLLQQLGPRAVMDDGRGSSVLVFYMAAPLVPTFDGGMGPGEPVPVPGPAPLAPAPFATSIPIPGSTTVVRRRTVAELVAEGAAVVKRFLLTRVRQTAAVGGRLLYEPVDLPTEHYPVVPVTFNGSRNPYGISDVRIVRDLQLSVNKSNSLILAHATSSTNLKVFYPEGSVRDKEAMEAEWGRAGAAFIPYDASFNAVTGNQTGGIVVAAPPPLPAALYENVDRFIALMERTLGLFSMSGGDASVAPETARGTLQIDEYAMRRIKSKMDTLYTALARAGTVALDFAAVVYTEEKTARLVQPDGAVVELNLNVVEYDDFGRAVRRFNDVTVGRYDAVVVAGSTLPSNRWALLDQYLQLYQAGVVDAQAVLQRAEVPDGPGILRRVGEIARLTQMVEQMDAELKKLQGDLQTAERARTNAEHRAINAKYQADLDRQLGQMAAAGRLFEGTLAQQAQVAQAHVQGAEQLARQEVQSQVAPPVPAAPPDSGGGEVARPTAPPDPFAPGQRPVSPYAPTSAF